MPANNHADARRSTRQAQDLLDEKVKAPKRAAALRDPQRDTSDDVAERARREGWNRTGGPRPNVPTPR